jgi:protein involved in polysaccharide export with SLBB domain
LEKDIEKAYADAEIYPTPTISVFSGYTDINYFGQPLIHLCGSVVKSGPVNFSKDMTLSEAIKEAGGVITELSDPLTLAAKKYKVGDLKQVKLFRDGKVTIYDITKVENHSLQLKKNDVIEVMAKPIE